MDEVAQEGRSRLIESPGNVDDREIAQLQSDAVAQVNAGIGTDGRLSAGETAE